jgi:hypothetical protein
VTVPRSKISRSRRSGWGIRSMTLSVRSVRNPGTRKTRTSSCTVRNGPNKSVKLPNGVQKEDKSTSGQALDEEKQEGNKRYFSCSYPSDTLNAKVMSRSKCKDGDNTNEISFWASTFLGSMGSKSSIEPTLGRGCC